MGRRPLPRDQRRLDGAGHDRLGERQAFGGLQESRLGEHPDGRRGGVGVERRERRGVAELALRAEDRHRLEESRTAIVEARGAPEHPGSDGRGRLARVSEALGGEQVHDQRVPPLSSWRSPHASIGAERHVARTRFAVSPTDRAASSQRCVAGSQAMSCTASGT